MNFISPELDIQLLKNVDTDNHCLYFKFKGKFTKGTAVAGTKTWASYMDDHEADSFEFVWDCSEMSGFEISARKEWYDTLSRYKKRLQLVYVVSPSLMIRSAAKVMLEVFGIRSVITKSEDHLPKSIRI